MAAAHRILKDRAIILVKTLPFLAKELPFLGVDGSKEEARSEIPSHASVPLLLFCQPRRPVAIWRRPVERRSRNAERCPRQAAPRRPAARRLAIAVDPLFGVGRSRGAAARLRVDPAQPVRAA